MKGLLFDIKEFALHDGGGIRDTVFFKGCPLRCIWCHNPEGLSHTPELVENPARCTRCGLCRRPCSHPECAPFGRCLHICPQNLLRVAGKEWDSAALAAHLLRHKPFFDQTGGGVTLSGGEPLMQADFCAELIAHLGGKTHIALETSGFATREAFDKVISGCDLVMMDLKIADPARHKALTGVDNAPILANARALKESGKPHLFRTPLIPSLTDTEENLRAIAAIAGDSPVELLPYNSMAPAKYPSVRRSYTAEIDPEQSFPDPLSLFRNARMRK
jgi:pyruvate formate lyase activating enzyme